jgi:hypothetical protein
MEKGEAIARSNLQRPGNIGSNSRSLGGVGWQSWMGRFHLEQVTVAGYSFGAAPTVEVSAIQINFNLLAKASYMTYGMPQFYHLKTKNGTESKDLYSASIPKPPCTGQAASKQSSHFARGQGQ